MFVLGQSYIAFIPKPWKSSADIVSGTQTHNKLTPSFLVEVPQLCSDVSRFVYVCCYHVGLTAQFLCRSGSCCRGDLSRESSLPHWDRLVNTSHRVHLGNLDMSIMDAHRIHLGNLDVSCVLSTWPMRSVLFPNITSVRSHPFTTTCTWVLRLLQKISC